MIGQFFNIVSHLKDGLILGLVPAVAVTVIYKLLGDWKNRKADKKAAATAVTR